MAKHGKIIIKKDNEVYEFNEKQFFQKERDWLYFVSKNMSTMNIVLNKFVSSIEFIDCDFTCLNKLKKTSLGIVTYCPIKITNSNMTKAPNISISANYHNVEIKNFESEERAKIEIKQGAETSITDVTNMSLDIIADDIYVSNYYSTLYGNEFALLGINVSLNNVVAFGSQAVRITGEKNLNWINTAIHSECIYIGGLLNTSKIKNSAAAYIIKDEDVKELLAQNNLYSVLNGLRNHIASKKQNIIEEKQETLKNSIDVEIAGLKQQIRDLENSKRTFISKTEEGLNKQKVYNYVKKNTK